MENRYNPSEIEPKWQALWEQTGQNRAQDFSEKPKWYSLVEFPYPSGEGLHVGHVRSYTALDVISRKRRMEGYNVLYPIGWDAFGLPTENFAIKHKIQPQVATERNVANFRQQLKSLGLSFDWSREVNTTDPAYYRWTQWIFLQFFKQSLAYKKKMAVNWCPSCKIVLANEEVINGNCERCGTPTEKREKEQWLLAITKYADRLADDLDGVDYWEKIKVQQRNWIGRSEGAKVRFPLRFAYSEAANDHRGPDGEKAHLPVFTTRADTLCGVTYLVLAPEHPWISLALQEDHDVLANKEAVRGYVASAKQKSEIERADFTKEKTGMLLEGVEAINPVTGEELPLYVADYVLAGYGTGAIMAVPAHDERDFAFATKYALPIKTVIEECIVTEGDREDAYRPEEETVTRHNVAVAVYDPKKEAYLAISWKSFDMRGVVTGGIEEGESIEAAARKELREETGYKNLKLIGIPAITKHTKFFHRGKKVNRHAVWSFALFELEDEERDPMTAEDQAQHEVVWVKRGDAANYFTVAEAKWAIELFEERGPQAMIEAGILVNSRDWSGLSSMEAQAKIVEWLEEQSIGGKETYYHLRDWIFSRQHYWGEPIPIIHCPQCGYVPVPEEELPVKLPPVEYYEPTDTGESPLAAIEEWVNVGCPVCKGPAKRETDTMPNWAGSSWYFLRYADPHNAESLADLKKLEYWMPIDLYNGGMEHTTLHLLYSRFWNKFLFDIGAVPVSEPYARRRSQGLVLAEDGRKMSKSWGNVANPNEIVEEFGADSLRIYELFMGPFAEPIPWSTAGVSGVRRFLEKVWKAGGRMATPEPPKDNRALVSLFHKTLKKVSDDIEGFKFNTAVSAMMIFVNALEKEKAVPREIYSQFLVLLSPFAPHMAEELWKRLGNEESIFLAAWPEADPALIQDDEATIVVQVNGKVRERFVAASDTPEETLKERALGSARIQQELAGREPAKVIVVPGKLVSIVV